MDNALKFGIHGFSIQCSNLQGKSQFQKKISVLLKIPLTLAVAGCEFCGFVWMKLDETFIRYK